MENRSPRYEFRCAVGETYRMVLWIWYFEEGQKPMRLAMPSSGDTDTDVQHAFLSLKHTTGHVMTPAEKEWLKREVDRFQMEEATADNLPPSGTPPVIVGYPDWYITPAEAEALSGVGR